MQPHIPPERPFGVTGRNDKQTKFRLSFSHRSEVPSARDKIIASLRERGYPQQDLFAVRLAINEALVNAIEHGNRSDPNKKVSIACRIDRERAEITVTDQGAGFEPRSVPDCTADENLCKTCGRGIAMMRGFMDTVEFEGKGNTVRLVKFRSDLQTASADQTQPILK